MKNQILFLIITFTISVSAIANNSNKFNIVSDKATTAQTSNDKIMFNVVNLNNETTTNSETPVNDEEIKKTKTTTSKSSNQTPPILLNLSKQGV